MAKNVSKKNRRPQTMQAVPEAAANVEVTPKGVDFAKEYHYVISDLRNMGMLALVMLVVLVGLSFIIQ